MLDGLHAGAGYASLFVLIFGPPALLIAWRFRIGHVPKYLAFVALSVLGCSLLFCAAFLLADRILEYQYEQVVGFDNFWTPEDEAGWTVRDRRIVDTHFGDGGRNLRALIAPIFLGVYSSCLWLIGRGYPWAREPRRTARTGLF